MHHSKCMNLPEVTVIIPAYNAGKYIEQCLQSVYEQTFKNWECIVIDDGSTDNTGAICDEFANKDSRFRIVHSVNQGVSASRNKAISLAEGKYIQFVDADDTISTEMLEVLVNNIRDNDMVVFGFQYVFSKGSKTVSQKCSEDLIDDMLSERIVGSPWNKFVTLKCIRESSVRFNESLSFCEDKCFFIELLLFYKKQLKYACIDTPLYNYNQNSGSLTRRPLVEYVYKIKDYIEYIYPKLSLAQRRYLHPLMKVVKWEMLKLSITWDEYERIFPNSSVYLEKNIWKLRFYEKRNILLCFATSHRFSFYILNNLIRFFLGTSNKNNRNE